MDETHSHGSQVAQAIMRADLGHRVTVSRFGSRLVVHHMTNENHGHWLTSIDVDAAQAPIAIHDPRTVFVPYDANRYEMPTNRDAPPKVVEAAGAIRERLVAMRDDGLLMTASELRDMLVSFRDLLSTLREEGYNDASGHGANAAALMARHNPTLQANLEPESVVRP